jgi:hypothetical protein
MTTAESGTRSDARRSRALAGTRRVRVDVIRLGALVIAALGFVAAILVVRTPMSEPRVAPGVPTAPAFAPPVRDQWHLDQPGRAPTVANPAAASVGIATTAAQMGAIVARDQWYLDSRVVRAAPPLSSQVRDRWYRD